MQMPLSPALLDAGCTVCCGCSLPASSHSDSQARPVAATSLGTLAGPSAATCAGSTTMARVEPRYMPDVVMETAL